MSAADAVLARLAALHPKVIDLSLERMWRILAALGHPERHLPPVIHVAGTNGKGSTIAFLRAALEAAGQRVHVYTSPHLVRFNERIRLAGALIDDAALLALLEEVEDANTGAPITIFEITTAAALLAFSRTPADVLLLEVGLGGRLDATNVVAQPQVTAITPVSMDHIDFLGETIEAIAAEKAGILKRGRPAVIGPQGDVALDVLERQARRVGAPAFVHGQHWHVRAENGRLVYEDEEGLLDLPLPRLEGRHQIDNAGLAIACLRAGRFDLPASALEAMMMQVDWPARLQRLTHGPLVELLPAGTELWLDGSHNPDGGRVLATALADLSDRVPRPLVAVMGMLATKDPAGFLNHLKGLVGQVLTVDIPGQAKAIPAAELARIAGDLGFAAEAAGSIEAALRVAGDGSQRVLITGSLYLAGHVLDLNGNKT